MLTHFSPAQLFVTLWTAAHQAPLSVGLSREEYWSGLPFPPPGNLPDPGIEPASLVSPALQAGYLPLIHLAAPIPAVAHGWPAGFLVAAVGSSVVACELLAAAHGIQFPDQGSNPSALHWECGVPVTAPPGKSWRFHF